MSASNNTRNLIAACAAITVFGLAFGMTYPLLSLILESRGVSTGMIGINSAMMPIGILLFSSVIPIAAKRFGSRNLAVAAALATSVFILAYKVFDSLEAWFLIRLLQGMSISTLFVLSEAWIVGFAGSENRGKVVAIYASALSASFGAGPAIVGWIGIEGWAPFIIGSLVILAGVIPLTLVREAQTEQPEEKQTSGLFAFAPKAPMLLMAVGAFAVFDAATLSLLPVYGVQNGLSITTSATALTALIIGNVVLQFPLGWLADKYPHRLVLAGCALATVLGLLLLPMVMATLWMWPTLVLVGATGYGVYTVSLTSLGDRFSGSELVNGSAAFAVMWGTGALFGSVSGGWSMSVFGTHGLPIYLALVYLLLVAGLIVRGRYLDQG
jgi:MFS family permease